MDTCLICLNCKKYVFDTSNVNKFKRLTCNEYVNGFIRRKEQTNETFEEICIRYKLQASWLINRADCELCGAPHAICSDEHITQIFLWIAYWFSSSIKPSEKDKMYIEDFRQRFFSR